MANRVNFSCVIIVLMAVLVLSSPAWADPNLVSHWKLNEGSGSIAYDSAGTNHGTLNGDPNWTTGQIDGALSFDGSNDYVDCGNDTSLDITGSISISAWVRFENLPSFQTILDKRGADTNVTCNYGFRTGHATRNENDELEFYYHDGTNWHVYTTSNVNLSTLEWYHVAVTFTYGSGASLKCYVNGNSAGGSWTYGNGNSAVQTNTQPVIIGGLTNGERLDGKIDDARIYDRAISSEEIEELYWARFSDAELAIMKIEEALTEKEEALDKIEAALEKERAAYDAINRLLGGGDLGDLNKKDVHSALLKVRTAIRNENHTAQTLNKTVEQLYDALTTLGWEPDPNLVGHWKLDEGTGSTASDSAGSNHGTLNGDPTWTTGQINGALSFDGIDDYVDCGNDTSLDITGSVSIAAWVRFENLPSFQTILDKRGADTNVTCNYGFRTGHATRNENDELEFYYHDGTNWHVYTTSNVNLSTLEWYHVAVTLTFGTGTSLKCRVNSNSAGGSWYAGSGNLPVQTNTQPVIIGGLTNGERLDGKLDDVRIYDRALTIAELQQLYNDGL